VVGVEDERDVEGAGGRVGGLLAVEHPEEVSGVGERLVGLDDGFALADAVEDGDDHRDLGRETVGFAYVGVVAAVCLVGVVDAEKRDGGAEDLHGCGVGGNAAEEVDDLWIEFACGGEMPGEFSKLSGRGEFAEPEEVGALLEGGSLCEFVDIDAAIGEDAGVAVDPADGGRGGDDAFQALWCDSGRHKVLLQ
jgi:hypothetical protein